MAMRLLSAQDIWAAYSMEQAIDDVAAAFAAQATGRTDTPLRTRLNLDSERTVLAMPCYGADLEALSVKMIALYPGNARRGLPTAPASVLLLDAATGLTRALLDGDTVTRIRTGASSGLAFRLLGDPGAEVGTVIGSGGQALTQVLAMATAAPTLRELRVVSRSRERAEALISQVRAHPWLEATGLAERGGSLVAMTDADAATADAALVTLATSARQPVIRADALAPGATVSCVGSYQPHMQECGTDTMVAADAIYCDDVEAALAESGDLIVPLGSGAISQDKIVGSIGQLVAGQVPGRHSASDLIVYETVGVAAQDLWTAQAVTSAAEAAGTGMVWG